MAPVHIMIQPYSIQFTLLNNNVLRLTRLEPIQSTSLLPLLNIFFFNLALS